MHSPLLNQNGTVQYPVKTQYSLETTQITIELEIEHVPRFYATAAMERVPTPGPVHPKGEGDIDEEINI